jgi:tRNA pseudouridine55 synthase
MHGVLVLDKPAGPTSFDVVRRVRALLKVKKAGHTGTLDPIATGVLPICLGDATKVAGLITEGDKGYDAVIRLGQETDTLDAAGKIVAEAPVPSLTAQAIEEALARFRGPLLQTPPMYSAIKIAGKRLYELARAGEEVAREARHVVVHELVLRDWSATEVTLSVFCSKGFFVRVLAQDLGRALGCGGHLKALRRTRSGPFSLAQAVPLDRLIAATGDRSASALGEIEQRLVSIGDALGELASVQVSAVDAARVAHGVPLETAATAPLVRVLGPSGELLAIADVQRGRLKYRRVLTS